MFTLYVEAPFARFQPFVGGKFRPTQDFIPPSAAYGLVLNIASIEMREGVGQQRFTQIDAGLPPLALAIGALEFPTKHRILQQLHTYAQNPAGEEKEYAERCQGHPHKISPCWREFLVGIKAYIAVEAESWLAQRVHDGLAGKLERYGVPFLGDSNYTVDVLRLVDQVEPAYWYVPVAGNEGGLAQLTRMTVTVDRTDSAKTVTQLFQPTPKPSHRIPPGAWVSVQYSNVATKPRQGRKAK